MNYVYPLFVLLSSIAIICQCEERVKYKGPICQSHLNNYGARRRNSREPPQRSRNYEDSQLTYMNFYHDLYLKQQKEMALMEIIDMLRNIKLELTRQEKQQQQQPTYIPFFVPYPVPYYGAPDVGLNKKSSGKTVVDTPVQADQNTIRKIHSSKQDTIKTDYPKTSLTPNDPVNVASDDEAISTRIANIAKEIQTSRRLQRNVRSISFDPDQFDYQQVYSTMYRDEDILTEIKRALRDITKTLAQQKEQRSDRNFASYQFPHPWSYPVPYSIHPGVGPIDDSVKK